MIFDGQFKEVEELILNSIIHLDDLSEEAFELFKDWIEKKLEKGVYRIRK